jgi:hypothetical protein
LVFIVSRNIISEYLYIDPEFIRVFDVFTKNLQTYHAFTAAIIHYYFLINI